MKGELGRQIMKKFAGLRAKHIAVWKIAVMKIKKKQTAQKSALRKENLNFKII